MSWSTTSDGCASQGKFVVWREQLTTTNLTTSTTSNDEIESYRITTFGPLSTYVSFIALLLSGIAFLYP